MRAAAVVAQVSLVRLARDRSNVFFLLIFPLLLVLLLGLAFGGETTTRVGAVSPVDDPGAQALLRSLEDAGLEVVQVDDEEELRSDVSRGFLSAGVVVPAGLDEATSADPASVAVVTRPDAQALAVRAAVDGAVTDRAAVATAVELGRELAGVDAATAAAAARLVGAGLPGVEVRTVAVAGSTLDEEFAGLGRFDLGASSQLFLFTFLSGLVAGAALIELRELGVARRMVATPTSVSSLVAGLAGGRVLVAWGQSLYIVVATVLLFGVDWGDPAATTAVVLTFGLVAGGAGTLLGATLRNQSQASGAAVGLGLGIAALGGSMVPLEIFPETVRSVALVTPHAWANLAMAEIVRRDAGLVEVLPQLGVLGAFAVVLLVVSAWRLRVTLTR